jgi:PAS domain S-box-containing protein
MPGNSKMIVEARRTGEIVSFNAECERVTGYTQSEVLGKNLLDLVPDEWRPVVLERFDNGTRADLREPHRNPWRTKQGAEVMIEWSCSFIDGEEGGRLIVGFGRPC